MDCPDSYDEGEVAMNKLGLVRISERLPASLTGLII